MNDACDNLTSLLMIYESYEIDMYGRYVMLRWCL